MNRVLIPDANRNPEEAARVQIHLADQNIAALDVAESLTGPDAKAFNSFDQLDIIKPNLFPECRIVHGVAELEAFRLE